MKDQTKTNETRSTRLALLLLVISVLLHSLVLTPVYFLLASNVKWNETLLPQAIGYLQLLLEYAFYWLLFVFLAKSMGKRKVAFYLFPILVLLLFRQALELVMGYSVMGFPSAEAFFGEELLYLLLQLLFDGVLIALATLVIHFFKQPKRRAFLLAFLPFLAQIVSLGVMLSGYVFTKEVLREASLDLVVHILCLLAGFGVIFFLNRPLGKETENEKAL